MNDFLSRCRHNLYSLFFHDVTSLHPLSFHSNDLSLVYMYGRFVTFTFLDLNIHNYNYNEKEEVDGGT